MSGRICQRDIEIFKSKTKKLYKMHLLSYQFAWKVKWLHNVLKHSSTSIIGNASNEVGKLELLYENEEWLSYCDFCANMEKGTHTVICY